MNVPSDLAGWDLKVVAELCRAGLSESDRHDFKAGLPDARGVTRLCCAFANTFGGFVVLGVAEAADRTSFEVVGVDVHTEWYGQLVAKIRADPDIAVRGPKVIELAGTDRAILVFHVPQSPRRPHLPTPTEERVFWKRQGSSCVPMTLEEIRLQMVNYEEKREKLSLVLIDLFHKMRSLEEQANVADRAYTGDMFSFETIDRVVAESFSILRGDLNSIGALDTLRKSLLLLNVEKQKMLRIQSLDYTDTGKAVATFEYRNLVRQTLPGENLIVEQIERSFKEKFGIENPFKVRTN